MAIKALCIHGHFYQPPREDPITGIIPMEEGAAPYQNWNEKILAECYRPNAEQGNFEYISFNVGPTLFSWLAQADPVTYQRILSQDYANLRKFGVGNAIAQSYNHTILPLASNADKIVQISWGIADFQYRFGRQPQGMWLPEAAVDMETLGILADHGITFTILAPWQADLEPLDTNEPYKVTLPGNKSITVFFYNRELSGKISFDPGATANADHFAKHDLIQHFKAEKTRRGEDQLVLLASDGELYGHHQPFREHFLTHLLDGASAGSGITPIFPALWLRSYPPRKSVRIRERTSWSCHHGVSRWLEECACTPLDGRWKAHLRKALDRLSYSLDSVFFDVVYPYVNKPRALRQGYIHAILGMVSPEDLIHEMAGRALPTDVTLRIQLLLEAQRERQRMFTSCGWFFDDFDRIEPKNNIAYAAQAVRLTQIATGEDLAAQTIADLSHVISPRTGLSADKVFTRYMERTWVMKNRYLSTGTD